MSNKGNNINHLWIILDWNRRWAKSKFLPSLAWHKAWWDNIKYITELAEKKWIKYITVWWLSTNNLIKRSKDEIEWIIKIIDSTPKLLAELMDKWVKIKVIWNIDVLPENSQNILKKIQDDTKDNIWILLTIALVYWWQDEIVRATKKIIKAKLNPDKLTIEEFKKYLDTSYLPNPDIIVRTWWDIRHSGFLLFDSEYSEYYFTDKKWPEFDEKELDKVIEFFNSSKRNFWK